MNEVIDDAVQAGFESMGPQLIANCLSALDWEQVKGTLALHLGRQPTERERQLFLSARSLLHLRELRQRQLSQSYQRWLDEQKVVSLALGPMWPVWAVLDCTTLILCLRLAIELSRAKPTK